MIEIFTSADDAILVKAPSELNAAAVPRFEAAVVAACALGCTSLRIDLSECVFVDASAVALFARLARRDFGDFEVAVLQNSPVHQILDHNGTFDRAPYFQLVSEHSRERWETTLHEWLYHERL